MGWGGVGGGGEEGKQEAFCEMGIDIFLDYQLTFAPLPAPH